MVSVTDYLDGQGYLRSRLSRRSDTGWMTKHSAAITPKRRIERSAIVRWLTLRELALQDAEQWSIIMGRELHWDISVTARS